MRRIITAAVLVAAAGLALPATGQARIVEGQGLAGVKLGDTKATVERVLGKPKSKRGNNWDFRGRVDTRVWFKRGRVDGFILWNRAERTAKGIGIRSTAAQVKAAYPAANCVEDPAKPPYIPICFVAGKFGGKKTETYFRLDKPGGKVNEISIYNGTMLR